jgi:hypothetical protein
MICPKCKEEGKRSTVQPGFSSTTAMGYAPYYDEEGRFHRHDPNVTTTEYTCSNGHTWKDKTKPSCHCGWPVVEAPL